MRAYTEAEIKGKTKKIYSKWSKRKETSTKKVEMWAGPYPLYTLFYDEKGFPYFYGKWGGSANMDAYNLTKTDACMADVSTIMHKMGYHRTQISWESVGTYSGMPVVKRFAATW